MRNALQFTFSMLLVLLSLVFLGGCEDLIETDLSESQVQLRTPKQEAVLPTGQIRFWWEEVEGAETYQVKIIKGSFDSPDFLEIDSSVTASQFDLFLVEGNYSWQVTAQNQSSATVPSTWSFIVDSNFSLQNEQVVLLSPETNHCTSGTQLTLEWLPILRENIIYQIDVRIGDFSAQQTLYKYESEDTRLTIELESSIEGDLSYGVRAVNDFGATPFAFRSFSVDRSAPSSAALVSPADGDTLSSGNVLFRWTSSSDSGCSIADSLVVYADSAQSQLVEAATLSSSQKEHTANLNSGTYYWQLWRKDAAGNTSQPSETRKLTLE